MASFLSQFRATSLYVAHVTHTPRVLRSHLRHEEAATCLHGQHTSLCLCACLLTARVLSAFVTSSVACQQRPKVCKARATGASRLSVPLEIFEQRCKWYDCNWVDVGYVGLMFELALSCCQALSALLWEFPLSFNLKEVAQYVSECTGSGRLLL